MTYIYQKSDIYYFKNRAKCDKLGSCIEQVQFSRGGSHAAEGRAWEPGLLYTST